jgi:deoxyribonuclease-4
MPILGAHMSIAGGYYKAVEQARACGCDCVQLFTKNNNQWRAKPLSDDDVTRFQEALARLKISYPVAHDAYLINLAAPDPALWKQSVDAFIVELWRAERLGIPYVITHPGASTTSSEQAGLAAAIRALDEADRQLGPAKVGVLLENTAGQGSSLGWRFEHLAHLLGGVRNPDRLGVCIDTCHLFAAGYPLSPRKAYLDTLRQFDRIVGLEQVKAIHLNDSRKPLGSRVDRHAHIGRGQLGLEPFRHLLNDRRLRKVPMYLETPKEKENGREMDEVNLETLRGLVQ